MAAHTGPEDGAVVHPSDAGKLAGLMAIAAHICGFNMLGRLAPGGPAIMTTRAATPDLVVIDSGHGSEPGRNVTALALITRSGVIGRRGGCRNEPAGLMTIATAFWRALECSAYMAAFASGTGMRASQRETGLKMVEIGTT